jgi:hypothetical protein
MEGSISELVKALDNPELGWVARRDAAEALGKIATESVTALSAHLKDKDMDVLIAVEACLEPLHVLLQTRDKARKHYSLRDLAQGCEKKGERDVVAQETGYVVTVTLPNKRRQRVYLMRYKSQDGRDMVRIFTMCGRANKDYEHLALQLNRKFSHAAFALQKWKEEDYLVLVNNILRQEVTPDMVKRCVKEMAYYGDWLEEKIEGTDEL